MEDLVQKGIQTCYAMNLSGARRSPEMKRRKSPYGRKPYTPVKPGEVVGTRAMEEAYLAGKHIGC